MLLHQRADVTGVTQVNKTSAAVLGLVCTEKNIEENEEALLFIPIEPCVPSNLAYNDDNFSMRNLWREPLHSQETNKPTQSIDYQDDMHNLACRNGYPEMA